ncbi:hypothetical protein [Lymphocystis disease virus 2]|nr:hypothetical protein [Lymphocystis disease virus 2]
MSQLEIIDEILYKLYDEYILSIDQIREICDLKCACQRWQKMIYFCQYSNRYVAILNEYFSLKINI